MRIGLVPVSAKPYHAGHHALVTKAANENEKVILFVSTSDRKRSGEFPIFGTDMLKVWQEELENIMPGNVEIQYGGSPVRNVYETLSAANDSGSSDVYVVYSDPVDTAQNYPETSLVKYCNSLRSSGKCLLAAEENPGSLTRGEGTPNISGTKVRHMLQTKDLEGFITAMPAGANGQNIFNILIRQDQNEVLIRNFIREIIVG